MARCCERGCKADVFAKGQCRRHYNRAQYLKNREAILAHLRKHRSRKKPTSPMAAALVAFGLSPREAERLARMRPHRRRT